MTNDRERDDSQRDAVVRMFCAYCRKSLVNARRDIERKRLRDAGRERLFSDMRESELNRLAAPDAGPLPETTFDVLGHEVGVADPELADALRRLCVQDRILILLHYFAEWPDRRIGAEIGCPRSTVQFRRSKALRRMRKLLEERGCRHDYV